MSFPSTTCLDLLGSFRCLLSFAGSQFSSVSVVIKGGPKRSENSGFIFKKKKNVSRFVVVLQISDGERSDQDLVVDDGGEVRISRHYLSLPDTG